LRIYIYMHLFLGQYTENEPLLRITDHGTWLKGLCRVAVDVPRDDSLQKYCGTSKEFQISLTLVSGHLSLAPSACRYRLPMVKL
jgi:hypothetical protein